MTSEPHRLPLVEPDWLARQIGIPDIKVIIVGKAGQHSDVERIIGDTIAGATFIDIVEVFTDTSGIYPNTFPTSDIYHNSCNKLGITDTSIVVILDYGGIYLSPRLWYIFHQMGHQQVYVVNGGLPAWQSYLTHRDKTSSHSNPRINVQPETKSTKTTKPFLAMEDIRKNLNSQRNVLIDVRSSARFDGSEPEPRAGLRSGKIPGSINIPYSTLLQNGRYKSSDKMQQIFATALGSDSRPLIFSCGSGVTACIGLLAAHTLLYNHLYLYDGSWTEWGSEEC